MNRAVIILFFFCFSCKYSSNTDYDNPIIVDTTRIDSNSIKKDNFEIDNQLKQMQEMQEKKISHEEVIQSNKMEDYKYFYKK